VSHNERAPGQSLADAIANDSLLASRLLQLASYAPGLTGRVVSVMEAINSLGADTVNIWRWACQASPMKPSRGTMERRKTAPHLAPVVAA
jgi:HD-like signal output (HDOD) protein